jgi:hypothetical protein
VKELHLVDEAFPEGELHWRGCRLPQGESPASPPASLDRYPPAQSGATTIFARTKVCQQQLRRPGRPPRDAAEAARRADPEPLRELPDALADFPGAS